ncbi:Piwi domain protein [Aphelenchoides besseyi]|nr:Piwi domain protein [Aphelenchoides besseyi]KAI6207778.1 Piwi domain protein [Aphelenchoides besseyi]
MSQCVLFHYVERPTAASCANIVLKINTKLGGVNSCLVADEVSTRYLVNRPVFVLGIDVTHSTQIEKRAGMPSVASVVGNLDTLPQVYGANVKVQRRCRESVVYVTETVRERVVAFLNATSRLPERILVYRDGVSSGQFAEVLREELNGIRAACAIITTNYRPPSRTIFITLTAVADARSRFQPQITTSIWLQLTLAAQQNGGMKTKHASGNDRCGKSVFRRQDIKQTNQEMQFFVSVTEPFKERMYFI